MPVFETGVSECVAPEPEGVWQTEFERDDLPIGQGEPWEFLASLAVVMEDEDPEGWTLLQTFGRLLQPERTPVVVGEPIETVAESAPRTRQRIRRRKRTIRRIRRHRRSRRSKEDTKTGSETGEPK
jgi:hypothetical protein